LLRSDLSVSGQQVNEYLAGLAGLTVGALLPSPLASGGAAAPPRERGHRRVPRSSADLVH